MKSSKHVETCFVRANNDFDAKLTAFWMKKKIWTKIPKKRTLCPDDDFYILRSKNVPIYSFVHLAEKGKYLNQIKCTKI